MCKNILDKVEWYRVIPKTLIDSYTKEFYILVDQAYYRNIIAKNTWEYIRTNYPEEATLYDLPNVHKNSSDPPGRPIVSRRGSLIENLSRFVDNKLRPFVDKLHKGHYSPFADFGGPPRR